MNYKKMMSIGLSAALSLSLLTACGGNNSAGNSGEKQVVIYSNADEEAVTAMKNALSKMNAGWETTAMLMGDSWLKTILRVVTPNALSSLIEVFSYYFINSMVTISALIFIAGARTMVLTTMIKQLQYVNRFNEVFVLSLLILATNLAAKALFSWLAGYRSKHSPKITKKEGIK